MKVAIYSRVMDWDHRLAVQELFDDWRNKK